MSLVCRQHYSDEVRATNEKVNPGVTKGRRRALDPPLVLSGWKTRTVGPLRIGDDVITKDSLFVIIVEIDTRIYKTYILNLTILVHPNYPKDNTQKINSIILKFSQAWYLFHDGLMQMLTKQH